MTERLRELEQENERLRDRVNIEHAALQECMAHEVARIAERDEWRSRAERAEARLVTDDEDAPEPCPDCRAAATPRANGIWVGCCDAHAEVRRLTVVADPEDGEA